MLAEHNVLSAEGFLDTAAPLRLPDVSRPLTGVTIGPYTLQAQIGHGGMGTVWSAVRSDGRFEGRAAVKLLNASLVGRAGEERFRREGSILARLAPPHVARLLDAGVSGWGPPYLVPEHADAQPIDVHPATRRPGLPARPRRRRGPGPPVPGRRRRRLSGACEPDRSSRHQAVQRARGTRRTGQAPRFRDRQAPRGRGRFGRRNGTDARGWSGFHARVRCPGA